MLEDLWHEQPGPVRDLYHGILQIGVGLYHREQGNRHGAIALIRKGLRRLTAYGDEGCQRVDVRRLVADTMPVLRELEQGGEASIAAPSIAWLGTAELTERPGPGAGFPR